MGEDSLKGLLDRKAELEAAASAVEEKIGEKLSRTLVRCSTDSYGKGCGMGYEVRELTYIQTHWYVSPGGCTEGDYWRQGEGQWACLNCKKRNRLYDKPEIENLKRFFLKVIDEHKD